MIVLCLTLAVFLCLLGLKTITVNASIVNEGVTYQSVVTATGNNSVDSNPSVPAAVVGQLTTRTDNTTGTLTMTTGHGFATGNIISLFWAGGSQRDVTLGTVSGNSCPFSLGTGDNLPANLTAITACIPTSMVFVLTGNSCTGILAWEVPVTGDGDAYIEFETVAPAVTKAYKVSPANPSGFWDGTGTNPLSGAAIVTCRFSHGAIAARTMGATALYT